jgi:hypothetical protein
MEVVIKYYSKKTANGYSLLIVLFDGRIVGGKVCIEKM